jgi:hypothetical protein
MEKLAYARIKELISKGNTCMESNDSKEACDIWLTAWNEVLQLMIAEGIAGIDELQKKYERKTGAGSMSCTGIYRVDTARLRF